MFAQPGVLREDRTSRREITDAPIAEPAAVALNVHSLGDHELGGRRLDVRLIRRGIARDYTRIGAVPSVVVEQLEVVDFVRVNVKRQLERPAACAAAPWQRRELAEFVNP